MAVKISQCPYPINLLLYFELLWEDEGFLDLFCSGCPELALAMGSSCAECPAGLDPHCAYCERHGLALALDAELRAAAEALLSQMDGWGCLDPWR